MRTRPFLFMINDKSYGSCQLSYGTVCLTLNPQLFKLSVVFLFQNIADRHFSDDVFDGDVQARALAVVGGIDEIDPVLFQQLLNLGVALLINPSPI